MTILIITSILMLAACGLINRIRGSDDMLKFIPIGSKHKGAILFGIACFLYFGINGIVGPNSIDSVTFGNFSVDLLIATIIGFTLWASLGWGDYIDMGLWQRHHPDGKEIGVIDRVINKLAKTFPKYFIRRDQHVSTEWDGKHRNGDFVATVLRYLAAIPMFGYLAWHFASWYIVLLPIPFAIIFALSYYIISRKKPNDPHWWEPAEIVSGVTSWGIPMVIVAFLVI